MFAYLVAQMQKT